MKAQTLFIIMILCILSCNSNDDRLSTFSVESTLIAKGDLYGDGAEGIAAQNMVITNESTWNALVIQMDSVNQVSGSFSETTIDFSQYTIIAIFDEIRGNGGHSIELGISSTNQNIIVSVNNVPPEGNATTVITQPFHLVKISKPNLPIIFQ